MAERYTTRLGGLHFYTYDSGFPYAFICVPFILMAGQPYTSGLCSSRV